MIRKRKGPEELAQAFLTLKSQKEIGEFLEDILTLGEIKELTKRLGAAKLLHQKKFNYKEIAELIKTSTTTVTRVAHWLKHGRGGYRTVLKRLSAKKRIS